LEATLCPEVLTLSASGPSAQFGAKIAHAPPEALSQELSQRRSVKVTDLGCDRIDLQPATVKESLRAFDAQILDVREWRFAEHGFTPALQRTWACRQRGGRFLQREPVFKMFSRDSSSKTFG
jgi:hypothetical protein